MIDPELMKIMCCPESYQPLAAAESAVVEEINQRIATGQLQNRGGRTVVEKIDGGLIRADKKFLYPIRHEIPIMLIDEAIPLES
jgi:uncharacterized protein YbaR (Trm112 family)